MLRTLTWLTNKAVDEVTEEPEAYDEVRQKLIDVLVYEEERIGKFKGYQLSTILKESWAIGASCLGVGTVNCGSWSGFRCKDVDVFPDQNTNV
ncbi:uncharacterized protein ACLA_090540 [Aspergillus clavatus NRRL 1]|uniref:Uncharacterized protein n=1 Tax=Aspergillus clavatus (strain ATCC 1007 / CBS 513.65 / DSM 816 / NCTC 3887 / NRRL 1 / QM 1276 / 107) TaxID=344612 RepID=A1CER2_ASPCL|nr:uncharacterized protein ACLA_090540 [Aspergillus clavatus NRRL 1]EAW11361.1 hypothetical protein ACLA_090540 [Aspergillus clavatus NRRL 1]